MKKWREIQAVMNEPSEEQQVIIHEIMNGNNVVVDACAGSGKSTTILSCAIHLPNKTILQTTYNAQLRQEIQSKINEFHLKNIKVYTYHCIAVHFYHPNAFDDNGIRMILRENTPLKVPMPYVHLLVLDECQDMSFLYFQFMVKLMKDIGNPFQLLILGDKMQSIYAFRGASSVFLTSAKELWENHPLLITPAFVNCTLHTSYRITEPMAHFVNNVMLGENRLIACKPGIPVHYIRRPIHQISIIAIHQIKKLISENKCTYGDIFILSTSLKKEEIKKIENAFVESEIPCYVPIVDTQDRLDNRAIEKKVVFSSLHAVKGRQRKYVFVVGFDTTFYYKYDEHIPKNSCPNTLYVACTRATHGLYLLENESSHIRPLPFLRLSHQEMKQQPYIHFVGNAISVAPILSTEKTAKDKIRYITPTTLIQFVSDYTLDIISPLLNTIFTKIDTEPSELDIPSVIPTKNGFYEEISDLNGNAIPIMYCSHLHRMTKQAKQTYGDSCAYNSVLQQTILGLFQKCKPDTYRFLKNSINHMPETCETISDYLYVSNILQATETKLYSKLKQIQPDEYDWITDEVIDQCFQQLDMIVGPDCKENAWIPEKTIIYYSADEDHFEIDKTLSEFLTDEYTYRFQARIDLLTDCTLWEFKCTSKITVEHMLQLVIYAWIWLHVYKKPRKFRLFNIKTNELWELNSTLSTLTQIVVELIRSKYYNTSDKLTETDYIRLAKSLLS